VVIIPEKGFVCLGPYRGWCGTVHRNPETAEKCLKSEHEWCEKNLFRKSDRDIYDIHDEKVGKKKMTRYYLRPIEEIPIPELNHAQKLAMMKILKVIYKGLLVSEEEIRDDLDNEKDMDEHLELLERLKIIQRVDDKWQSAKTHDKHKWEDVVEELLDRLGGI